MLGSIILYIRTRAAANRRQTKNNSQCAHQGSKQKGGGSDRSRVSLTPISMPGRRGSAPVAGAAGECIHRSARRSEPEPITGRQCQIPRDSTRARRTQPLQPAPAHRLLQPAAHWQPPAHCRRPAQPHPPHLTPSPTPTARPLRCAGAPEAAAARTGQVNFAPLQNAHNHTDWHTARRAHTAPPAPKGAQSLPTAPPRCHPSQVSAAQQPHAAAPPMRGVLMQQAWYTPPCAVWQLWLRGPPVPPSPRGAKSPPTASPRCHPPQPSAAKQPRAAAPPSRGVLMHQAWHNLMCAVWQHQPSGSLGCARMWVGSG